jgi:hypothetical protein
MNITQDQYYDYILPACGLRKKRMCRVIKRNTVDVNVEDLQKKYIQCKYIGS